MPTLRIKMRILPLRYAQVREKKAKKQAKEERGNAYKMIE